MPQLAGKLEWRIQAVGMGVLGDVAPVDLGVMTAELGADGSITVGGDELADRLTLAVAAFTAVMNA